jgi:hypothetical protein
MNSHNPFKPPVAAVADIGDDATASRDLAIKLLVAAVIQLAWLAMWTPGYVELTGAGALQPIGLLFVALGSLCLYAGVARAFLSGHRGHRLLFVAAVFSMLGLADWWRAMPLSGLMPIILGVLLSGAGWVIVRARAKAARMAPVQVDAS